MSCLFQSLGALTQTCPKELRQEICDYLASNPPLFDDDTTTQGVVVPCLDTYVRTMREPSTWGGAVEIKAFCDLYRVGVVVYDTRSQPPRPIEFLPRRRRTRTLHLLWNGGHYEPGGRHP